MFVSFVKRFRNIFLQHPWHNDDVEKKVEVMLEIVKTMRSIKEEYLTTRAKADGIQFFCRY